MTATAARDLHVGDAIVHPNDAPPCPVERCTRARSPQTHGRSYQRYCSAHQSRQTKHGSVLAHIPVKAKTGEPWPTTDGYFRIVAHGHPLSDKHGRVYLHRMRLYDRIGPGTHPCHHCGKPVAWFTPFPIGLEVDHLDSDRANNDAANLVPCCHACNVGRGGGRSKTHCPQGHPKTIENTGAENRHGKRRCRICSNAKRRQRYAQRRATK